MDGKSTGTTIPEGMVRGDPDAKYIHISAKIDKVKADPDAGIDVACFMTTDTVDADNEVVLPSGADFGRYDKNPVVMVCHAYGQPGVYYPLPVGRTVWHKHRPKGILAGVQFARSSAMGKEVKGLFEEDMLRSFSIGFRSLESSPMTRAEADSRTDWKAAYDRAKGKIMVHRRWELLELSVAPVPSNPDALVGKYKSVGRPIPQWLELNTMDGQEAKSASDPQSEMPPFKVGDHARCSHGCGEVKSVDADMKSAMIDHHDENHKPTGDVVEHDFHELEPFHEIEGQGEVKSMDGEEDDTEEMSAKSTKGFSTHVDIGDHVKHIPTGRCGEVKAIHHDGEHPVAAVDHHDATHKCMGVVKIHPIAELQPFESVEGSNVIKAEEKAAKGKAKPTPDTSVPVDDDDLPEDGDSASGSADEADAQDDIKAGDDVKIHAPHHKGHGKVMSVHKHGVVPDVEEDMMGTKKDPAVRVKVYKQKGDGFVPTGIHVAHKMCHCTKFMGMNPPVVQQSVREIPVEKEAPSRRDPITNMPMLPPLVAVDEKTEAERLIAEMTKQVRAIPGDVEKTVARFLGVV